MMTKEDILNGLVDGNTYNFDVDNTTYWIYKDKYNICINIYYISSEKSKQLVNSKIYNITSRLDVEHFFQFLHRSRIIQ